MPSKRKPKSSARKTAARSTDTVRVGLVQMSCSADPKANLQKAIDRIGEAARKGAQIVCLQELFRSLYFCQSENYQNFDLAEPVPGPSTEAISKAAKRHGVAVVASLFERRTAGIYHNTTAVLDADGSYLGMYRKMHIPDDPLFYEKYYFTPGDLGFRTFRTKFAEIGVLICWDQWYPEGARLTALQGAQILFYPTAIGWHPSEKARYGKAQHDSWETIQRAHAIANGVYVAVANRVGHEHGGDRKGGIEFWGQSFLCDPQGQFVARASASREEILVGEADLKRIEVVRRNWPFLRDRRIDAYGGLTRRYLDKGS